MGITSSKDPKTEDIESNPPKDQVPSEKLEDWSIDLPIHWDSLEEKATAILMLKEMDALFPSELKDGSERLMELAKQVTESLKGGDCKELVVSLQDCMKKSKTVREEYTETFEKLYDCMYSHPKYYHPYITAMDNVEEELEKRGFSESSF